MGTAIPAALCRPGRSCGERSHAIAATGSHARRKAMAQTIGTPMQSGNDETHFARPTDELCKALATRKLHRNFQGYTTDTAETLIGLGASSIGRTSFGYVQNASDNAGWTRAIDAGKFPVMRGKAFEGDDLVRARVIEELLCYFDVDLSQVEAGRSCCPSLFEDSLKAGLQRGRLDSNAVAWTPAQPASRSLGSVASCRPSPAPPGRRRSAILRRPFPAGSRGCGRWLSPRRAH